jgi:enolase
MSNIRSIHALEILDSRGNPTVRAFLELDDGTRVSASVPSGASTGENEALEKRDGDKKRYGGKGVLSVVAAVNDLIGPKLAGRSPDRQADIDRLLIEFDGTPNKGRLGANAILAVSMAVARAAAASARIPLYAYLGGGGARRLPVPMMNILNGGKHAENKLDLQEFMVVPLGAPTFSEALRAGVETFHALKALLKKRGYATGVGDEGGFAPDLGDNREAVELIVEAIGLAGYAPGQDIAVALDPAASSFWKDGAYHLDKSGRGRMTSAEMNELYADWVKRYPIVSIEDGLAEEDWQGFAAQTALLGDKVQIVGDDIYCTTPGLIAKGIAQKTSNAALIKLNQIGTVTETVEAITLCREAGWGFVLSHRSGETEDSFLADFAVAMGGRQIKTGSACRSERISKYNRLLEIEAELGTKATFSPPLPIDGSRRKEL